MLKSEGHSTQVTAEKLENQAGAVWQKKNKRDMQKTISLLFQFNLGQLNQFPELFPPEIIRNNIPGKFCRSD